MIKPTVGHKVWYRPSKSDQAGPLPMVATQDQPLDATVIAVWGDRCVNLLVTDIIGRNFPVKHCTLVQEGDEVPEGGRYAEWAPRQIVQAKVGAFTQVFFKGFVPQPEDDELAMPVLVGAAQVKA